MAANIQIDGAWTNGEAASLSIAFDNAVAAGNAILVAAVEDVNVTGTVTDNIPNAYAVDLTIAQGANVIGLLRSCLNAAGGATTVTYTPAAGNGCMALGISEFSGMLTAAGLDDSDTGTQAWGKTVQTAQITTTEKCVVVAFGGIQYGSGAFTSTPAGFTNIYTKAGGGWDMGFDFEYKIQGAGGNEQPDWAWTTDKAGVGLVAGYKMAVGRAAKPTRAKPLGVEVGINFGVQY